MAFKALTGYLLQHYWFPFSKTHVVKPVAVPAKDCEKLCAATAECCRWGVREVKTWEDATTIPGATHLGWEVHGDDFEKFVEATWCTTEKCAANGATKFKLAVVQDGADWNAVFGGQKFAIAKFPGKDGAKSFYILVVLTQGEFSLFDKSGKLIGTVKGVDALKLLKEAPHLHNEVTFVKSYSCGLFKKATKAAKLRLESLESGFLKKCETEPTDSAVDAGQAFAQALAKANGKWSVDVAGGSRGISFASIVCAVFASVSLVFVVLFVAKKNSHLEVLVADE